MSNVKREELEEELLETLKNNLKGIASTLAQGKDVEIRANGAKPKVLVVNRKGIVQ